MSNKGYLKIFNLLLLYRTSTQRLRIKRRLWTLVSKRSSLRWRSTLPSVANWRQHVLFGSSSWKLVFSALRNRSARAQFASRSSTYRWRNATWRRQSCSMSCATWRRHDERGRDRDAICRQSTQQPLTFSTHYPLCSFSYNWSQSFQCL